MKTKDKLSTVDKYRFLAPIYDYLASLVLGKAFHESKWTFLEIIQPGDTVWVIGGGTGAILPEILKRCGKNGKIIYMEASNKMLEKAKGRVSLDCQSRVEFICSEDFGLPKEGGIDVVITQFLLDVLTDHSINSLFQRVKQKVSPSTSWLFLDFYPVKDKQWLIHLMITSFSLLAKHPRKELPDYEEFFKTWGWGEKKAVSFEKGFYKAKLYRLAPKAIKSETISLK